jgi:hypothetical protein
MKATYTRYNFKTGIDKQITAGVLSIKEHSAKERDICLDNGKTIYVGPHRSELYGKSGYLGIVDEITINP